MLREPHRLAPRSSRDRGSAAAELALAAPLLVLMLMLVVAVGRLADARLQVDGTAMQAARAASLAGNATAAGQAASGTARAALAGDRITCSPVTASPDTSDFTPGGQVRVQVSCTVSLSGLSLLPMPGALTLTAVAVAPVDPFRDLPATQPVAHGSGQ